MPKILIIEDDNILSKAIRIKFVQLGFSTLIAIDGKDALIKVKLFHPDAILLDLLLPKKSGEDVLAELKKNSQTKIIPVFVCSVKSDPVSMKICKDLGIAGYFVKSSYTLERIANKIQNYLKANKAKK
jgi:DNA-binding response OmpR family regulator